MAMVVTLTTANNKSNLPATCVTHSARTAVAPANTAVQKSHAHQPTTADILYHMSLKKSLVVANNQETEHEKSREKKHHLQKV